MRMNWNDLSSKQVDFLKEVCNIGAGNAATALAKLFQRKIMINVPELRILELKDIACILGEEERQIIGILIGINGDIEGDILYVIEIDTAHRLLSGMVESDDKNKGFSDFEISAFKEMGNIIVGSYITALSKFTGLKIRLSVPQLSIDMAGAILAAPAVYQAEKDNVVLYIETDFLIDQNKVMGDLFLIPCYKSFTLLSETLGVNG